MGDLTGMVAGVNWSFVQYNGRMYGTNGRNRPRVYDGQNWRNIGIYSGSAGSFAAAAGSAGNPDGYYNYYIVPCNMNHVDINGSPVCGAPLGPAAVTLSHQQGSLTNIPATHSDAQVTHWRVFRNKSGGLDTSEDASTQDFYWVADVTLGTSTYTDNTSDSDLVSSGEVLSWKTSPMPTVQYFEIWKDRLFGCGFSPITTGTCTRNGTPTIIDFATLTVPDGVIGLMFQADGEGKVYEITGYTSSSVTLSESCATALSGAAYSIYGDRSAIYHSEMFQPEHCGQAGAFGANRLCLGGPFSDKVITGIRALGDHLYVFTQDQIWEITENGLGFGVVGPIYDGCGAVGNGAIWRMHNKLWFLSLRGPMCMGVGEVPQPADGAFKLGHDWLDALAPDQLSLARLGSDGRWLYVSVPETGKTENTITYALDLNTLCWWPEKGYRPTAWLYDLNSSGKPALFFAQDNQIYEKDVGTNDGVPVGSTMAGTATAGSSTTVTDSTASFKITGNCMNGLTVEVYTSANVFRCSGVITSNTATQLTFTVTAGSGTVVAGDKYRVGARRWWWKTKTFSGKGALRVDSVRLRADVTGSAETIYKTDYVDDTEVSALTTVTVNKNDLKLEVGQVVTEYAAKIEGRNAGQEPVLRSIEIEGGPEGADKT